MVQAKAEAAKISVFELMDMKSKIDPLSTEGIVPGKRASGKIEVWRKRTLAVLPWALWHPVPRPLALFLAAALACGLMPRMLVAFAEAFPLPCACLCGRFVGPLQFRNVSFAYPGRPDFLVLKVRPACPRPFYNKKSLYFL